MPNPNRMFLVRWLAAAKNDLRRRGMTVLLQEVMLGEPDGGESGLVGGLDLVQAVSQHDPFVIGRPRPRQRRIRRTVKFSSLPPMRIKGVFVGLGCKVFGCDVAEGHGWADGRPGTGIAAAHDRRRGVAHRVQPAHHGAVASAAPGRIRRYAGHPMSRGRRERFETRSTAVLPSGYRFGLGKVGSP